MKRYRVLAATIFLTLAALVVASCDPGGPAGVDPRNQTITFWYQHQGAREQAMQALIQDFNNGNKWGITVHGEFAGSYADIYIKLMKCIAAGGCPDLSVAYQNQAATYNTHKAVVELTPYIESNQWGFSKTELADFFPFVSEGDYLPQFKGRYGFAPHRSMEVLYFNEDWLKALGYQNPPSTWDEFAKMACAATDRAAGTVGYELSVDASTYADMVFNRGGSMVNNDGTAYVFNGPAGLDALTGLQQLVKQGCAVPEAKSDDDQTDFGKRKVLFIISSTSSLPFVRSAVGGRFQWSVSTLPTTLPIPRVNIYGASLSVFKSTPERQLAAWLFIKWLTEPEQSASWTRATDYFPVRRTAKAKLTAYLAANPQLEKAFGFLDHDIAIEPGVVGYDECRNLIGEMLSAVVVGENAQARLEDTVKECNRFLLPGGPAPPPGR